MSVKIFVLEITLMLINKFTIFLIWIVSSFPSLQPSWFNYFLDPVNQLCSLNCSFPYHFSLSFSLSLPLSNAKISPSITPVLLQPQTLPHSWSVLIKGGLVDWATVVSACEQALHLWPAKRAARKRLSKSPFARCSRLSCCDSPNNRLLHRHPKLTLRGWNVISIVASGSLSRYKRPLRRCSWDIEYWGLRTINIVMFYLLINKLNKEYLSLLYLCVSVWLWIHR